MLTTKTQVQAGTGRFNSLAQSYAAAVNTIRHTPAGRISGLFRAGLSALGWLGILGIGIIFICMALYFSALRPGGTKLQLLRDNVAMHEKHGMKPESIVEAGLDQTEQLTVFYQFFPARKSVPEMLGKIYDAAADEGLNLDKAEYKAGRASAGKMIRYQLTLPIRGDYFKIQKFLIRVLRDVPSASLEKLLFERKNIDDPAIDATVTLVLHLGPES